MDLFGTKILVILVLTILIVFSGAVPPAYKKLLDTWYGRIVALLAVLMITNFGGWPLGILAVVAALTLMPVGVREGFDGGNGIFHPINDAECVLPPHSRVEGFEDGGNDIFHPINDAECVLPPRGTQEGFEADKLQVVPAERRQRWFIERIMHENPVEIETNNVETLPTQ